tara:strand:+ start:419 stop:907 length:489 start_codon:yes stop_codon:yes gene_type:complete
MKLRYIQNSYDNSADVYNSRYKKIQYQKYMNALTNIDLEGKILDLGSGTGLLSKFLHHKLISLDLSYNMLTKFDGTKVQADMSNIPFKENSFDFVLSFSSLMNSDNIENTLKEIRRITKKEGRVIISYLNKYDFSDKIKKYFKIIKKSNLFEDELFILEQKV